MAVLVAATGSITVDLGAVSVRSHSPWRFLAVAAVALGVRVWRSPPGARRPAPEVLVLLTLILLSLGYWFKYQLTTVGGADSYGYASAARLLASGRLVEPAPLADWLSSPHRLALLAPLGWAPAAADNGIVPAYPLGLPAVMAVASAVGAPAIHLVSPAMGMLTLWLVFAVARRGVDQQTALLATALVAWNPVFLAYAKQPLSDVPASAWMMVALFFALPPGARREERNAARRQTVTAGLAGAAAGAALLTRPALIVAAAVIPLLAAWGPNWLRRVAVASLGVGAAVGVQMGLQAYLFGSPMISGYGSAEALFSWGAFPQNVAIYARQSWAAFGGVWIAALAAGVWALLGYRLVPVLTITACVAAPYLFYLRFDHWESLRFFLPALVPASILVAAGVTWLVRLARVPAIAALGVTLVAAGFAARSERFLSAGSVWDIPAIEARYSLAGQWIQVNTPAASVVLADQHSGSMRWYGARQTVRWDLMADDELVRTVHELERHGATVYAALEGRERERFEAKFAATLPQLTVDMVGSIRNVTFLRLISR